MIRYLLFAALGLFIASAVSALAFRGQPTLMDGKAPSGGGGGSTACDIGPNFTGTIPAAATAAGFTHCAANYDFTTASYANPATWLDCAGASSPQWYCSVFFTVMPTNAVTLPADGALPQVLDLHYFTTNYAAHTCGSGGTSACGISIVTNPNNGGASNVGSFPMGMYYEVVMRNTTATRNSCQTYINNCLYSDVWSENPGGGVVEFDFLENYGDGGGSAAGHANAPNVLGIYSTIAGWDPTTYETIGSRITNDGTTIGWCFYLNGSLIPSGSCATNAPGSGMSARLYLLLTIGPQNQVFTCGNGTQTCNSTVDNDLLIEHVRVFSCASWQTTECVGTVNP